MKKNGIVIGILFLVCIVGVVLAFLFLGKDKVPVYTVTFDSKGGTYVESQSVLEGDTVTKPEDPERDGYKFVEWLYLDESFDFSLEVTLDLDLVAKWEKEKEDIETFVFRFDSDGGTTIANQILEKGKVVIKPDDPVKDGYKFLGWYLNEQPYNFDVAIEKDMVIKAKWEKIEEKKPANPSNNNNNNNNNNVNKEPEVKKYVVKFNSNGGSSVDSQNVNDGKKAIKPVNPTKEGYGFIGWTLDGKNYNFDTKVTKDIELTANWLKNPVILKGTDVNYDFNDSDETMYTFGIDFESYLKDKNDYNSSILAGWEFYVSTDENLENSITVNGVKYVLQRVCDVGSPGVPLLKYGKNYKFIARVFIEDEEGKKYSDWSSVYDLNTNFKAPKLDSEIISYAIVDSVRKTMHDIFIDFGSYRYYNYNYLSGWELYVVDDNGDTLIDGVGYSLDSDNGNESVRGSLYFDIGKKYKYRARVYKNTSYGKIYSDWSDVFEINSSVKTPLLKGEAVGNDPQNGDMVYDVLIHDDPYSFGLADNEVIYTGWELYSTSNEKTDNELTINGVKYYFHSDNNSGAVQSSNIPLGETNSFIARVYVETAYGKIYSDWSNVISATGEDLGYNN